MKILIALDGSEPSMAGAMLAKALPLPADSTIELLTVMEDHYAWTAGPWPVPAVIETPPDVERALRGVHARLQDIAAGLTAEGRTIRTMVRHGRPASEILTEADRFAADLIVVGARGHTAVERLLVGSVSSEVVDHANCPVLIVRTPRVGRVLIATDGSADADAAAAFVGSAGIFRDSTVKVLSVVDPGMPWWAGISPVDGAIAGEVYLGVLDAARRQAREFASSTAARLGSEHVVAEAAPRGGEVGSTILADASAWHADLVVLGTRGHGMLHRALVGSTSRHVLHHAPMSVLVVRPPRVAAPSARVDAA